MHGILESPCLVVDDCNAINPLRQQGPLGAKAGIQSTVQRYRIHRFERGIKRMVERPCKHFWVQFPVVCVQPINAILLALGAAKVC